MTGRSRISQDLWQRCRDVFSRCSEFGSDDELRAMFITPPLDKYKDGLPQARSTQARVNACLDYLYLLDRAEISGGSLVAQLCKVLAPAYAQSKLGNDLIELSKNIESLQVTSNENPLALVSVASQLPNFDRIFGRDEEINRAREQILKGKHILILEGLRGMGKSTLANAIAQSFLESNYFDAYIWWSARYNKENTLNDLLDHIERYGGRLPENSQPIYNSPDHVHDLLRGFSRCLLIVTKISERLHNDILRFLSATPRNVFIIITTSASLDMRGDTYLIQVDPLNQAESIELIHGIMTNKGWNSAAEISEQVMHSLVQVCDGSPVALRLALGLLKIGKPPDYIFKQLKQGRNGFQILCAEAYNNLSEQAKYVFRIICLSTQSISEEALSSISDYTIDDLEELHLPELRDAALIYDSTNPPVAPIFSEKRLYPAYQLIRDYFLSVLKGVEDQPIQLARANYYLHACEVNGKENWVGHDWVEQNIHEICGIMDWLSEVEDWEKLVSTFNQVYYFMGVRGYWREKLCYGSLALLGAQKLQNPITEAHLLVRVLGWAETQLGHFEKAEDYIRTGLKIYKAFPTEIGGQASAYRYLAAIERRKGESHYEDSRRYYDKALTLARKVQDKGRLTAGIKVSLSTLHIKLAHLDQAEQELSQALEIFTRLEHVSKIAEVWSRLGDIYFEKKLNERAKEAYTTSQQLAQQIKRKKTLAYNELGLARLARLESDTATAQIHANNAMAYFANLGIADESSEISDLMDILKPL